MNRSIGIVWFNGEGFSNCKNLSSRWGKEAEGNWREGRGEVTSIRIVWLTGKVLVAARIDGGKSGEGSRCRGKGEGEGKRYNNFGKPVLVLKR